MDPVTGIFLIISLLPFFSENKPICDFTEQVIISRGGEEVAGELTTPYYCDEVIVQPKD